ncbi:uncharacterized protein LOC109504604, partial [Harpegnathos saltator]|uniref:uncharacterized protein LOC109504604 n=1 Tax=Harpegnathos saltator TaxID=610380 RepID=UPI0009491B62
SLVVVSSTKNLTTQLQSHWRSIAARSAYILLKRKRYDVSGRQTISLPLYVIGGIAVAIVLLTCCCTLFVRNKCARLLGKLTGRKKQEKYYSDVEQGRSKRAGMRESRKRKKRERDLASRNFTHTDTGTEAGEPIVLPPLQPEKPERQEDESPIACYKCYRKKQRRKRRKRQTRR